ncbi:probable disease resistance protein At1g12280 [Herrania umbratica]|uniref:Probable disease resistance protein At1g12280 n=1 Tax=Herrania umbratica TaxID=108875 RepID=A0A6J1BFZ5_9ROSI|nr:probable disease resistance protein At1g12280 [Herrania umbratica]
MSFSFPTEGAVSRCWDGIVGQASYICKLEDNLEALKRELAKLNARMADVKKKVDLAEQQHMERLNEVQLWLSSVQTVLLAAFPRSITLQSDSVVIVRLFQSSGSQDIKYIIISKPKRNKL